MARHVEPRAGSKAYWLAIQVNAESLPDDVDAAAQRLVRLCERAAVKAVPAA